MFVRAQLSADFFLPILAIRTLLSEHSIRIGRIASTQFSSTSHCWSRSSSPFPYVGLCTRHSPPVDVDCSLNAVTSWQCAARRLDAHQRDSIAHKSCHTVVRVRVWNDHGICLLREDTAAGRSSLSQAAYVAARPACFSLLRIPGDCC